MLEKCLLDRCVQESAAFSDAVKAWLLKYRIGQQKLVQVTRMETRRDDVVIIVDWTHNEILMNTLV